VATETFTNQPSTTVTSGGTTAPVSGTSETWTVASSASFPTAATGTTVFHVKDTSQVLAYELIAVTNVSGTTWTVTRGAEGTTPVQHSAGFTITQVVSAGWLGAITSVLGSGVTMYTAPLSTLAAWSAVKDYVTGPPAAVAKGTDGLIYGAAISSGPSWGGAVNPVGNLTGYWLALTAATGAPGATGPTGATGAAGQGFNFRGLYNSGGITYNPYDAVIQPTVGLCIVAASSAPFTSGTFNPAQWIILYPNQVIAASGAPSNATGNNGDTYIDTTALVVYGPKASGSWPSGVVIAPVSGRYLCTPTSYAPGTQTAFTVTSNSYSAVSSANVNTGSFTAPASGSVVVGASLVSQMSASANLAFSLATHGSTSALCNGIISAESVTASPKLRTMEFVVTGLTASQSYNLDLIAAVGSGTLTVFAYGTTGNAPTGTAGAAVAMTVQAV
jgi:hypothetical protein